MPNKKYHNLAIVGFVLDIPGSIIVSAGLLQVGLGLRQVSDFLDALFAKFPALNILIHPVVVIGGLVLAIGLNMIPIFQIKLQPQQDGLVTVITTQWRIFNIAILALSLFLFSALLLYAFVENFQVLPR